MKRALGLLLILLCSLLITSAFLWRYFHPAVERTNGVVYGQRHGKDLTMDIVRPAK